MTIHDDDVREARAYPERVGIISKRFEVGPPITFHVLAPYYLGEGEEWMDRPAMMYQPVDIGSLTDGWLKAAQERLHRSIGQRARAAKRAIRSAVLSHQIAVLTP